MTTFIGKLNPWVAGVIIAVLVGAAMIPVVFLPTEHGAATSVGDVITLVAERPRGNDKPDDVDADPTMTFLPIFESSISYMEEVYGYGWPWPRSISGQLVDFFAKVDARAFVMDFTYFNRSLYQDLTLAPEIAEAAANAEPWPSGDASDDDGSLASLCGCASNDMDDARHHPSFRLDDCLLACSIHDSHNAVIGAGVLEAESMPIQPYARPDLLEQFHVQISFEDSDVTFDPRGGAIWPLEPITRAVKHLGLLSGERDGDSLTRRGPTFFEIYNPAQPRGGEVDEALLEAERERERESAAKRSERQQLELEGVTDLLPLELPESQFRKRRNEDPLETRREGAYYLPSIAMAAVLMEKQADRFAQGEPFIARVEGRTLTIPVDESLNEEDIEIPLVDAKGYFRLKYHGFNMAYDDIPSQRILQLLDPTVSGYENPEKPRYYGYLVDAYYNDYLPAVAQACAEEEFCEDPVSLDDMLYTKEGYQKVFFGEVFTRTRFAWSAYRDSEQIRGDESLQAAFEERLESRVDKGLAGLPEAILNDETFKVLREQAVAAQEEQSDSTRDSADMSDVDTIAADRLDALTRPEKEALVRDGFRDFLLSTGAEREIWGELTWPRFQDLEEADKQKWYDESYKGWAYLRPEPIPYFYPRYPDGPEQERDWKVGYRPVVKSPAYFKDRTVTYMGAATALMDLRATPFYEDEVGGNMLMVSMDNIRNSDFIYFYNDETLMFLLAIVAMLILLALTAPTQIWVNIVVAVILLTGLGAASYLAYDFGSMLISPFYAWIATAAALTLMILYKYIRERSQKGFIKGAFGQYLSPKVIDQIMTDPDRLKLGGQSREMTALFSDMAKFSTISEGLTPEQLVALLNEYLTSMCDIILEVNGTIDKFEGDAIIAFWGAPIEDPDHAVHACEAVVKMQDALARARDDYQKRYNLPILPKMRIGLNSGNMVVGNMGTQSRMDYTIMGDNVNLAARLEGANKFYATYSMISDATYQMAKNSVEVRELDSIRVVGKSVPVKVYELLSMAGNLDPAVAKLRGVYEEGLKLYKDMRFQEAIDKFTAALALSAEDGPSQTYIDRCQAYVENPPPADWDRVYTLTSKG